MTGLAERPPDAGSDLRETDGAGESGAAGELVHEAAPETRALLPGRGVVDGVDEGHYAIADEDHGREVGDAGGRIAWHMYGLEREEAAAVARGGIGSRSRLEE